MITGPVLGLFLYLHIVSVFFRASGHICTKISLPACSKREMADSRYKYNSDVLRMLTTIFRQDDRISREIEPSGVKWIKQKTTNIVKPREQKYHECSPSCRWPLITFESHLKTALTLILTTLKRDIQCESLLRMRQSVIWYNRSKPSPNNGSKTVYSLTNYNVICYKKRENVLRQIRKTTKKPPFRSGQKFVERVQLHKPRYYTIYKCKRKRKPERRRRLTDLEWFKSLAKALNTSWTTPTTTREPLHRAAGIIISG